MLEKVLKGKVPFAKSPFLQKKQCVFNQKSECLKFISCF